ncbi:MAG: hypothetical protein HYV26_14770 [Candidatus Hydrogenedentes bacterium]|nr:hypothetical protein [Candidatus Hydrogenedentota bacterium]
MWSLALAVGLCLASGSAMAGTDVVLNSVTPNTGSFLGGTPVSLDVTVNTTPLGTVEVFFSADTNLNPAGDEEAVLTDNSPSTVGAITPAVNAPGVFNVYVRHSSGALSNSLPFTFTDEDETEEEAAARTLDDNFEFVDEDNNGTIDEEEAAEVGIDAATFDALDDNGDGELTQAEIDNALAGPSCFERIADLLGSLTIVGILAFLLSLLDRFRLFFGPFPGNPNPGGVEGDELNEDELENP